MKAPRRLVWFLSSRMNHQTRPAICSDRMPGCNEVRHVSSLSRCGGCPNFNGRPASAFLSIANSFAKPSAEPRGAARGFAPVVHLLRRPGHSGRTIKPRRMIEP